MRRKEVLSFLSFWDWTYYSTRAPNRKVNSEAIFKVADPGRMSVTA